MRVVDTTLYVFLDQAFFHELGGAGRRSRWLPVLLLGAGGFAVVVGIPDTSVQQPERFRQYPTVYCAGLKDFYSHVSAYLLKTV